ncbi:MAG: hypothetical protein AAB516_00975 [Patescibacteria group bacterium]
MDNNIFRAYDIRGKYPNEINEETVSKITELNMSASSNRNASNAGIRTDFMDVEFDDYKIVKF